MNKSTLFLLIALCCAIRVSAQTPRFTKYFVSDTNAEIYLPGEPDWLPSKSEDGSFVYTTSITHSDNEYVAIVVKFAESPGSDQAVLEALLMAYIKYLGTNVFNITNMTDFGMGHKLESAPQAYGLITFAEDAEGQKYAIKGWIDSGMLSVLSIRHKQELNNKIQDVYLNGFRFPSRE
jgi:hypothetical protein